MNLVTEYGNIVWKDKSEKEIYKMETRYITEKEKANCDLVKELFQKFETELGDIAVLDAGKFGYVIAQYYYRNEGFASFEQVMESDEMIEFLWEYKKCEDCTSYQKKAKLGEMSDEEIITLMDSDTRKKLLGERDWLYAEYNKRKLV